MRGRPYSAELSDCKWGNTWRKGNRLVARVTVSGEIHGEKATGSSPVCLGLSWEAPAAGCVTSDKITASLPELVCLACEGGALEN